MALGFHGDIAVSLQASKALKLCCRASWTCVINHCKMFADKSNGFCGDLSEDAIINFLAEACARTAFVLDVHYQCGSHKVNRIIIDSLESWSVAENLFERLASPTALVKQWVKVAFVKFLLCFLCFPCYVL